MTSNIRRFSGLHISTYENLHRKLSIADSEKQTSRSGSMSRKIPLYLTDEEEKEFEARFVEAVTLLNRSVSPKELIVKHLNKAYKLPIIEVMQ